MLRFPRATVAIGSFALMVALSVGQVGCAGGGLSPEEVVSKIPSWFSPQDNEDHLFGSGTALSRDLQMSLDRASEAARTQLTRNLTTHVSAMFQSFTEEVGLGDDAQYITMATNTSESVTSETLGYTTVIEQETVPEGKQFRSYVVLDMPLGAARARLHAKIKEQEQLYTRLRASQSFEELERKVRLYEERKAQSGTP